MTAGNGGGLKFLVPDVGFHNLKFSVARVLTPNVISLSTAFIFILMIKISRNLIVLLH